MGTDDKPPSHLVAYPVHVTCLLGYLVWLLVTSAPSDGGIVGYRFCAAYALFPVILVRLYWRQLAGERLGLLFLFMVSYTLFMQAQVVFFALGVEDIGNVDLRRMYPEDAIVNASLLATAGAFALAHGALFAAGWRRRVQSTAIDQAYLKEVCLIAGRNIFAFTTPLFLLNQALIVEAARSVGYRALQSTAHYDSSILIKVLGIGSDWWVAGGVLVLVASSDRRQVRRYQVALALYAVFLLVLGERTDPTVLFIVMAYLRSGGLNAERRRRTNVGVVVAALLLLLTFPAVLNARNQGFVSAQDVADSLGEFGAQRTLVQSVSALGYSLLPVIEVTRIVPEGEPYRYGVSYLAALTSVIPRAGIANEYSQLSVWLQNELGLNYGPGFAIPAEAYLNFGRAGLVPCMVILGALVGGLFYRARAAPAGDWTLIVGILFFVLNLTWPRREFLGVVNDFAYVIVPILLILKGMYRGRRQRANSHRVRFPPVSYK